MFWRHALYRWSRSKNVAGRSARKITSGFYACIIRDGRSAPRFLGKLGHQYEQVASISRLCLGANGFSQRIKFMTTMPIVAGYHVYQCPNLKYVYSLRRNPDSYRSNRKIQGRSQESKLIHQRQEANTTMPHCVSVRFSFT